MIGDVECLEEGQKDVAEAAKRHTYVLPDRCWDMAGSADLKIRLRLRRLAWGNGWRASCSQRMSEVRIWRRHPWKSHFPQRYCTVSEHVEDRDRGAPFFDGIERCSNIRTRDRPATLRKIALAILELAGDLRRLTGIAFRVGMRLEAFYLFKATGRRDEG